MKIMTALFDNARYRHDGSEEIDLYQKRGVDTTARPLVANCDFSNAGVYNKRSYLAGFALSATDRFHEFSGIGLLWQLPQIP